MIVENRIEGNVAVKSEEISFSLEFVGITGTKEGLVNICSTKNKRKYNLVTNSSMIRPNLEDRQMAFKKLVGDSECWYDKTRRGELQPRQEEIQHKDYRASCDNCGMPLVSKVKLVISQSGREDVHQRTNQEDSRMSKISLLSP